MLGNAPAADEARFLAERLQIRLTDTPAEAPVALVATQGQGDDEALEAALRNPAKLVLNSGLRHGREHRQSDAHRAVRRRVLLLLL